MEAIARYRQDYIEKQNPHEVDGKALPFPLISEMLHIVPFGEVDYCFMLLLLDTGCRIVEVDRMRWSGLKGNWLYWQIGKNQKGYRKAWIPSHHIKILRDYWENNACVGDRMLGLNHATLSTRWTKQVRAKLSRKWHVKKYKPHKAILRTEHKYKLKGFRKTYCTLRFAYYYHKFKDPLVAVLMVQKELKHSSKEMTAIHYIEAMEQIEAMRFKDMLPYEALETCDNGHLGEYM